MKKFKNAILGILVASLLGFSNVCGATTWVNGIETDNSDIDWDRDSVYYYDSETVFVYLKHRVKDIQTTYIQEVYIVRGEVAKVAYVWTYDANGNLKKEAPSNYLIPFAGTRLAPMYNQIIAYANSR